MKTFKSFNDLLALLVLIIIIPGLWVGVGRGCLALPGEVVGATISVWTMVAMYYWRKKPSNGGDR